MVYLPLLRRAAPSLTWHTGTQAGVLRPTLNTAIEIKEAIRKVTDGAQLIQRDLPKAAALLGQDTIGPLFQALLCHHANQGSEKAVNEAEKSEQSK